MRSISTHYIPAVAVSILRQEVDSLVRAVFLLSISDRTERQRLLRQFTDGERWTKATKQGKATPVTDREMVELADSLHGWTGSVYRFGCAFVHLTEAHDHGVRDPINALSDDERLHMLKHLRHYHGGPMSERPAFADIYPYIPQIFEKIATNLDSYLVVLERGGDLADR